MSSEPPQDDRTASLWALVVEAGRAAFAGVVVDAEALRELLATRQSGALPARERAAEVYLAFACAHGDAAALAIVEERYLEDARRTLRRRASSESHAEEALQRLRTVVFVRREDRLPEIADFNGSGPLAGWLRIAALRILLRLEQGERRHVPLEAARFDQLGSADSPEVSVLVAKYGTALQQAFVDAWRELPTQDRALLQLRFVDGYGIDHVATIERVHRATAARRLQRAEDALVAATRRILRERVRSTDQELDSVLKLIRSKIQLAMSDIVGR